MIEFCKHTPGPWSFHEWGADGSGRQFGIETADHKHGIAGIQPNGNASSLISMEEHRANARLIAAAPTMADELEKLRKILAHVPARVALKAADWLFDARRTLREIYRFAEAMLSDTRFDRDDYDRRGRDREGYDREGYDREGNPLPPLVIPATE